jgi:hypothetical protein
MRIPEEYSSNLIRAVEHYAAYLRATNRDDRPYLILAESLKREPPARVRKQRAKQRPATRSRR